MLVTALLGAVSGTLQIVAFHNRPSRPMPGAAIALYVMSAVLFWCAVVVTRGKLAACGEGCVSPEVVTSGPYRYIRHPFYMSYNLTWIAGFAATGWWPLAISAIVMAALYDRFAREEELGFATNPLAGEYREYTRRAGRYLPGTGRGPRLFSTGSGRSDRSDVQNPRGRGDAASSDTPRTIL